MEVDKGKIRLKHNVNQCMHSHCNGKVPKSHKTTHISSQHQQSNKSCKVHHNVDRKLNLINDSSFYFRHPQGFGVGFFQTSYVILLAKTCKCFCVFF